MRPADFLEDVFEDSMGITIEVRRLRRDFVRELRRGPAADAPDIEVAVALARLIHNELEAYGTDGSQLLSNEDMREAISALRAVLQRLGVPWTKPPFRDFSSFKTYWLNQGARNSWQARRDILEDVFETLHDELSDRENEALAASLATPVSPRGRTGWTKVDEVIAELRRHFESARSPQDYRNVGNDCVIVIETLSRVAYDPDRHLQEGDDEPAVDKTKERLARVVEVELTGPENSELRKLVRAAIEMAQAVKHRDTSTRRDAGMAADAVIVVTNLLRRIREPDR